MIKSFEIGDLKPRLPIIQGGMGVGVSLSSLASAVANSGGIGVISGAQIGFREDDFEKNPLEANKRALVKEIRKAKKLSPDGIIGLNLMVAMENYEEFVKVAVKEKIDLIISGAGLPMNLPALVKGSNVKIVPIVSSLKASRLIMKSWMKKHLRLPDGIIVEGPLAGGHLGFKKEELMDKTYQSLKDIVSEVSSYIKSEDLDIPIIAAGGIHDGDDIKDVMDVGADGVQIASRFVATYECDASDEFKNAYINCKKEDIKIMMSPVGLPGRAIKNEFLDKVETYGRIKVDKCYKCINKCDPLSTPFCITKALVNSVEGKTDDGLIFVGAKAYMVDRIVSVREVMNEFEEALQ
ncbi:MAG TPA: nitronate monooxygenase [Anaerovoracaceae bacterium]|nr:nitronate monooxygenase [Anaerovoracaceae bacterium]